jgi:hypothetical protein
MMSRRNRRWQRGQAIGSTKAERRHHRQELEAALEWILNDYLKPVECDVTTVTSAAHARLKRHFGDSGALQLVASSSAACLGVVRGPHRPRI